MTHYEILQVMPTAAPEVIRMAYKALASKYHPDVFQGDKEYAETKMKQINEAYRVLSSPASRQEYDNMLQREREQAYQFLSNIPSTATTETSSREEERWLSHFSLGICARYGTAYWSNVPR